MTAAATPAAARDLATSWLRARQHASGAWRLSWKPGVAVPSVAMTVLALTALADPRESGQAPDAATEAGLAWLATQQNPDGSFGDGEGGRFYRAYCTALALWVLPIEPERHRRRIRHAVDYLRLDQRTDGLDRGGLGHGMVAPAPTPSDPRGTAVRSFAIVSPTSMAARGLRRAGITPDDLFHSRIADFIRGHHNDPAINTRPDVERFLTENGYRLGDDGGIVSSLENLRRGAGSVDTPPEAVVSSGISTYQGLSAYLDAGLSPESPEVGSALRWVRAHYSVTEHAGFADVLRVGQRPSFPGEHGGIAVPTRPADDDLGQAGRYLYLFSMAQALSDLGIRTLVTCDGVDHDWCAELDEVLREAQDDAGFWVNRNPRWLEFDAVLSTAFALATINILLRASAYPIPVAGSSREDRGA
jgi:hypothetical protein